MPDLDLYKIHNLDRKAPSEAIAAQLTSQLNAAPDPLARQRIDTARTILGDPQRRARYDAQLADPQAPPITEQVLAALAGRPAPMPTAKPFAQPRVLAAVAAALGVLLVIVVSAVACSGGDDDSTSGRDATPGTTSTLTTEQTKPVTLYSAEYRVDDASFVPSAAMRIDEVLDLESTARKLGYDGADFGLRGSSRISLNRVTESGNIELAWCDPSFAGAKNIRCFVVTITPELKVLNDASFPEAELSAHKSKGNTVSDKYAYIRVTSGNQLPTDAITVKGGYTKAEALSLVAGASDDVAYFVVPGALKVYKATVVWAD